MGGGGDERGPYSATDVDVGCGLCLELFFVSR